jgi:acyl-coenzyme A synthetase/AMP-(fatty) acid ligase
MSSLTLAFLCALLVVVRFAQASMTTSSNAADARSGDRFLTPSPLFHMGCQSAMLMAPLANDASVCLVERFSASGFMPTLRSWTQASRWMVRCTARRREER